MVSLLRNGWELLQPLLGWSTLIFAAMGGWYFFWKKAREEHFPLFSAFDALTFSMILGVVVARLGYVVAHPKQFGWQPVAWIDIFGYPGLWSLAGLIVVFAALYRWAEQEKLDSWEVWDFAAIWMAWYFAWYWLSRFFFGAAAGTPTNLPWGIVFLHRVEPAHPVQLYAAVLFGFLFWYLWWAEPRYRFFFWYRSKKRTAKTGFLVTTFLIGAGLIGFLLAFVQYPFLLVWDLDLNQVLHALLFFLGCGLLYVRSGRTFFQARRKDRGVFHATSDGSTEN